MSDPSGDGVVCTSALTVLRSLSLMARSRVSASYVRSKIELPILDTRCEKSKCPFTEGDENPKEPTEKKTRTSDCGENKTTATGKLVPKLNCDSDSLRSRQHTGENIFNLEKKKNV